MLKDFRIQNFRLFSNLEIKKMGQVNLIVGRNNTGKTALLESIDVFASGVNPSAIRRLLKNREEYIRKDQVEMGRNTATLDIPRIFTNGQSSTGENGGSILENADSSRFVKIYLSPIETIDSELGVSNRRRILSEIENMQEGIEYFLGLVLRTEHEKNIIDYIDASSQNPVYLSKISSLNKNSTYPSAFLSSRNSTQSNIARLWDSVTLSDSEDRVLECMRYVAPVERISLIDSPSNNGRERTIILKLEGVGEPVPLKSMGDGIARMLYIALMIENLGNSRKKHMDQPNLFMLEEYKSLTRESFLLIDEIENGIHYSILPELWRFIFRMSDLYGMQVFASTHSWDCVQAFQTANRESVSEGGLIKLFENKGSIRSTTFDKEELETATKYDIEVR